MKAVFERWVNLCLKTIKAGDCPAIRNTTQDEHVCQYNAGHTGRALKYHRCSCGKEWEEKLAK